MDSAPSPAPESQPASRPPRVALVHDWLNGMRGGEKVFELLCELWPEADVYTLFYEPNRVSPTIRSMNVIESSLAKLPGARRKYRHLLPLLPWAAQALPIRDYDFVVSTSHCVAHGVRPIPAGTSHVSYCFTPMRYIYDKYEDYFGRTPWRPASIAMRLLRSPLQRWDRAASSRVTAYLTSSHYVAERIQRHYGRSANVVGAPVDCNRFSAPRCPEDFYLTVSALEPYKRIDLCVEAFRELKLPLVVAGAGSQLETLRKTAPPNVTFLGWVSDDDLPGLYARARALVFPADEDFGIVPLEAAAAGCPTLALAVGGSRETVAEGISGLWFPEQSIAAITDAVRRNEQTSYNETALRSHARQWDRPVVKERLRQAVEAGTTS